MKAWFLSDIHLKSAKGRNGEILLRFLHFLENQTVGDHELYLLGDIFDLWVGRHEYFARKYSPIVEALGRLHSKGIKVIFIEGNHDLFIDSYFQKKLGIPCFVEAQYFLINGISFRLEHGDLINLEDKAYERYRSVVRHPLMHPIGNLLPSFFWELIGRKFSEKSREHSVRYHNANKENLVNMIRNHAHRSLANDKAFDVILSGHMHVFDDYSFEENGLKARSLNLGSWMEPEVKVLCLNDKQLEWVTLT